MSNGLDRAPEASSTGDAVLARRVAAGDRDAEIELVQRFTRPLVAVLTNRLRQPELARDLVQETFIIAFERLRRDGLDDPGKLAGFLRLTAVNLAIGERRKFVRRRTDSDNIADFIDDPSGPVELLERLQTAELVRQLIAELPVERDRELLWRHYVLDHDKQTLRDEYALSAEHFERVLHRARLRLRKLAEQHHGLKRPDTALQDSAADRRRSSPSETDVSRNEPEATKLHAAYELPTAYTRPAREILAMAQLRVIAEDIVRDSTAADAEGFDVDEWLDRWTKTPLQALGNRTPAELLDTPAGVDQVVRLLGALQSGAYQ